MKRKRKGTYSMWIGLLLIAAALCLCGYNLWDDYRAERVSQHVLEKMPKEVGKHPSLDVNPGEIEIPDYILNPEMDMPVVLIDGKEYIGVLDIPSFHLSLPVMSQWSYPNLKIAPCRYMGSAYTGNMVIAAHNYNAHFGSLQSLSPGDQIIFTDVDGNQFIYEAAEMEVLEPQDIEEMVESPWDLTLFTCTYSGRTRFTVRCKKIT